MGGKDSSPEDERSEVLAVQIRPDPFSGRNAASVASGQRRGNGHEGFELGSGR